MLDAEPTSKIAIIVDAACDLPAGFIARNNIFVLPFNILTEEKSIIDDGSAQSKLRLYHSHINNKSEDFATTSVLPDYEIEAFLNQKIVFNFDAAVFISVSSSRSLMHASMLNAWNNMAVNTFTTRLRNGLDGNFRLACIDSATMGPGQGLLAFAAVAALKVSQELEQIELFLNKTCATIFTYGVANDLLYTYTRAKSKNENSITWSKYALANMLNLKPVLRFHLGASSVAGRGRGFEGALEQIVNHLDTKIRDVELRIAMINVSFSGDLDLIESTAQFIRLKKLAVRHGIELFLSNMSVTLAVHVGENAIMVGFSADSSHFKG